MSFPAPLPAGVTSLRGICLPDTAQSWADLGFRLTGGAFTVGLLTISTGADRLALAVVGAARACDGLALVAAADPPRDSIDDGAPGHRGPVHPNGVDGVDHLVLTTGNVDAALAGLAACGVTPRRELVTERFGPPTRQVFAWWGGVIVELLGPAEPGSEGHTRCWGVTFTSPDLEHTKRVLGPLGGSIRQAVQPGRRILSVRSPSLSIAVAVMDPHVRSRTESSPDPNSDATSDR